MSSISGRQVVSGSALLWGSAVVFHSYDDLASGVVSQHVGHRVRRLAERVGLVDDHLDVAGFEELGEGI